MTIHDMVMLYQCIAIYTNKPIIDKCWLINLWFWEFRLIFWNLLLKCLGFDTNRIVSLNDLENLRPLASRTFILIFSFLPDWLTDHWKNFWMVFKLNCLPKNGKKADQGCGPIEKWRAHEIPRFAVVCDHFKPRIQLKLLMRQLCTLIRTIFGMHIFYRYLTANETGDKEIRRNSQQPG